MKKVFLFFCLLKLVSGNLWAQVDTILYYNDNGAETGPSAATWYRNVHYTDMAKTLYVATDYYLTGEVKQSGGQYVREGSYYYPNGNFTSYYKTGQIRGKGSYIYDFQNHLRDEKISSWIYYYPNGQMEAEFKYGNPVENSLHTDEYLVNAWDSTGKQMVIHGDGLYSYTETRGDLADTNYELHFTCEYKKGKRDGALTGYFRNGKVYCTETYTQGKFEKGESFDANGNKYIYDKLEENPEFPGGDVALIKFLQKNIRYPAVERDNDIQGKVLLRFVVNDDGKVMDVKIVRGVSPGLDKEAYRVIKMLPNFIPGKQRGQLVKVYFNLPVVFKLQ